VCFDRAEPVATGRSAYRPAPPPKIYACGYLTRLQSSRRPEAEAERKLWLTGRLAPDFKTIADFRCDNGEAVCKVCKEVRAAVPSHEALHRRHRRHRQQQVQGSEQAQQELHRPQATSMRSSMHAQRRRRKVVGLLTGVSGAGKSSIAK